MPAWPTRSGRTSGSSALPDEPAPLTGTILVVSDDQDAEAELRAGLPEGLEVVGALDATGAIDALATWRPLVVVVDLQTGRAGGFALAKDLSQDPRLASVPVIILVERDQDRWLAGQAGATEVLRKPVDGRDLVRVISAVLATKIPA